MEAHEQSLAPSFTLPVAAHAVGQRRDVVGIVVILVDEPELGHPARLHRPSGDGVEHAGSGGRCILRVERQHHHAGGPSARKASSSSAIDGYRSAWPRAQAPDAPARPTVPSGVWPAAGSTPAAASRRRPDGGVLRSRLGRPSAQGSRHAGSPTRPSRNLDHAAVPEELSQIAAQRGRSGRRRGAQVHEQHRRAPGPTMRVNGFRTSSWPELSGSHRPRADQMSCGTVSVNDSTSNRTTGEVGSVGVPPRPIEPVP